MKKILRTRKGATMVELLVTFALLTIFMASAVAVITPCTQIFLKIKSMSYAQSVGDIVMNKVSGEIASATERVKIDPTHTAISFNDSHASPVFIAAKDGYLNIHYREVKVVEGETVTEEVLWQAVDWNYDPKAYQGYRIESLTFAPSAGDRGVEISLKLKNPQRSLDYKVTKTVECYNLPRSALVKEEIVYLDDKEYWEHYKVE